MSTSTKHKEKQAAGNQENNKFPHNTPKDKVKDGDYEEKKEKSHK